MVHRSAYRVLALVAGLASFSAACEPAGAIEESSLYEPEESSAEQPGDARLNPIVSVTDMGPLVDTTGKADQGALPGTAGAPLPGADEPSAPGAQQPAASSKTLRTQGNRILDTCGQPFVARGMEQLASAPFSADGTLTGLADELAKTGSNAVRILPRVNDVSAADIDAMLSAFAAQRIVVYISPGDRSWFNRADIKPVLLKHEKGLILDAFQEPDYDDRARWLRETKEAVAQLRAMGYTAPVTVLANQYGRDLTSVLDKGQEIVDSDPLRNTIIGWQAYWGKSGWYQQSHKLSLAQGVEASAAKGFPMQLGIDLFADHGDEMDYREVMAAAQRTGISWLWWNFWNQWDDMGNNASFDGRANNLTPAGEVVVNSDPNSIARTAKKACFR